MAGEVTRSEAESRLRLTLAYDGRAFRGWQSQPDGGGVQDAIEAAIRKVAKSDCRIPIHGAGRTDAGVHALGQVAHFDSPDGAKLDPAAWRRALNSQLPPAVRITAADLTPPEFHARFSATGKEYRYRIVTGEILPPHDAGLAWHVPYPLNLELLKNAVALFGGEHDFRAFAASRGDPPERISDPNYAVRTIAAAEVVGQPDGRSIEITFGGDGFLYKMVRLMVGSAVRVAAGRSAIDEVAALLDPAPAAAPPPRAAFCAPPDGLTLVRVIY